MVKFDMIAIFLEAVALLVTQFSGAFVTVSDSSIHFSGSLYFLLFNL